MFLQLCQHSLAIKAALGEYIQLPSTYVQAWLFMPETY